MSPHLETAPASPMALPASGTRGLLRVYLSYAPGTGKTYAMLQGARRLRARGRDVLVGLVESQGREEIETLLEGFPRLPVREGGDREWELDLDAALARAPQVLLLDNLAHANAHGRHPRRWGDVQELLAAGIEVHTTLNVGQVESVAEVVSGLTGLPATDVVPDNALEGAEQIVLVDLPPDALLERLEAGELCPADQRHPLFQKTTLMALRELAMRKAAHHVDEHARNHLRQQSQAGPWPAGERLLVCVGPSPYSERLVRATKRLADSMSATWIALHVDTGKLTPAEHQRVDSHLQLAQRLGAEVVTQTNHSLVDQVLETAAAKNVTKVVTGRTPHLKPWKALMYPSLADAVLRQAHGVDVLVLAGDGDSLEPPVRSRGRLTPGPYLTAAGLAGLATLLGLPLAEFVNPTIQIMLYLAAVVATAYLHGGGPSNFASVLAVVLFNFFFVEPRHTLAVHEPSYWLTFFGLLLNGLLVSRLTASVRAQSQSARLRERDAVTLLALSRDLAQASSLEKLAEAGEKALRQTFGRAQVVLMTDQVSTSSDLPETDREAAERAFRSGTPTGKGTETLPSATHQWHPLRGPTQILGVAGLSEPVAIGARRREDLLEAILNQVSAALERRRMAEAAQEAELLQESEKLHTALLNSISHDLRIPLVSIQGALTTLQEPALVDEERREALISNALSETDRLNRLVGNLLQKTRLETGHLTLKRLPCDVEDLISTTLAALKHRLEERPLQVDVAPDLPLVSMDFVLIAQVLTNLLENALAYSPGGTPISVKAFRDHAYLHIEVLDRGPGLGTLDPELLFEKFQRGAAQGAPGSGLGLSICRGLVEAHHGRIQGRSRDDGGANFSFTLPLEDLDVSR